ncbi:kunitz-type serine protease inhibitor vestiginin-7-like [Brachionus plicatilis]|uniref:Kunitz-type serine protease inhibitor vestiginin-7-like n=1 Tax=Brachionus plicatilis TaxID=10195 RepID=A0A3M7R9T2_BRAPC|nr:kunitz-type serine protease inhibitor vestiginin-7-like [Brachionus plicatilis]
MYTLKNIRKQIMITLLLVCVTSQLSLRNKRQQDPSETDYFSPLDESLRLDHLPLHDDTELEKIENDVNSTPQDQIVLSTVANEINGHIFAEISPMQAEEVTGAENVDQQNDYSTYFYDYNDYHYNDPENLLPSKQENLGIVEENVEEQDTFTDDNQLLDLNDTHTYDVDEDYGYHIESYDAEIPETIMETSEPEKSNEINQVEYQDVETESPSGETINAEEEDTHTLDENNNDEDASFYIDEPDRDQLLKSNRIAEDYENEVEILKPSIWFKQMIVNETHEEESHLTANCPDLNCEFGFKTDLYGKPICSCFNPCHEKKCGANICKIEKISESKYIGACYDPTKIERPIHCHLPLATGSCKNYTSRFYFNSFLQRCAHFVYTGCEGNHNNFDTWEKCEMECNTCSLPATRGPCHGNIIRYYYDSLKRECVAFNWGGCKGNENNFKSRKHCEDSCIFRREGALFLHGMPIKVIRKYHQDQIEENSQN